MDIDPYRICVDLYGACSCADAGRAPCDSIALMAENDETAQDERDRIEQERDTCPSLRI